MNIKDAIWGFIVGDALGVPYEFTDRTRLKECPAKDMIGHGTYNQVAGTWSDDTSMMLCVIENIIMDGKPKDLAHLFLRWYNDNYMTPHGELFDIGNTTRMALQNLMNGSGVRHSGLSGEGSAGNGTLMRCVPYAFIEDISESISKMVVENRITHKNSLCHFCCIYFVKLLRALLEGKEKRKATEYAAKYLRYGWRITDAEDDHAEWKQKFSKLFHPHFCTLPEAEINSTGYVLDTLEASVWCFLTTDNYKDAVLKAVNLGGDTDTIAALTGALSGLYYGADTIPQHWKFSIANRDLIESLVQKVERSGKFLIQNLLKSVQKCIESSPSLPTHEAVSEVKFSGRFFLSACVEAIS